jgi:hypothetical protein
MHSALRSLVLLIALAVPAVARAQAGMEDLSKPQLFTIEGVLAPDQAAADKVGYDPLSIGFQGGGGAAQRWIGVVGARALGGDSFRGKQVIEALLPKSPNLLVAGPAEIVSKLQTAPNGSRVLIQGILEPPTRNYMLDKVEIVGGN